MNHLEKQYENVIRDYPNLIFPELRRMPLGRFGDVGVCLRQEKLQNGIIDLAFVTETTVFLVELKRDALNSDTLQQIRRYKPEFLKQYPNHEIRCYLVGESCSTLNELKNLIGKEYIEILVFDDNIPHPRKITECPKCFAGQRSD